VARRRRVGRETGLSRRFGCFDRERFLGIGQASLLLGHQYGLSGSQFSRQPGFCQHLLPQNPHSRGGFHRIRYYGFMSANSRMSVEEVRWLASFGLGLFFVIRYGVAVGQAPACRFLSWSFGMPSIRHGFEFQRTRHAGAFPTSLWRRTAASACDQ
jgi:hypothetical protein